MTIENETSFSSSRVLDSEGMSTQQLLGQKPRVVYGTNVDSSRSMVSENRRSQRSNLMLHHPIGSWIPGGREGHDRHELSLRRRIFLLLTDPKSSPVSAMFYAILMTAIFAVNIIMMMQTMDDYQYTPDDCVTCGGETRYFFDVDDLVIANHHGFVAGVECVCPPEPLPYLETLLKYLMHFLAMEWTLRIVCFVEKNPETSRFRRLLQWLGYLTSPTTLMDALAIFPFYLERIPHIFVSLRLLKSFQIFQLIRLGQYNALFHSLTNVMAKSLNYLRLLVLILAFGSAFFGSLIYWVERGTWQYHRESEQFLFVRVGADGVNEEPSPFRSIPDAFWWFMVTATTVGYGDYYPTSTAGKWIACFAMMMGVLVIAFPVSVFSDLWQQEIKKVQGFDFQTDDDDDDNDDDDHDDNLVAKHSTRATTSSVTPSDDSVLNEHTFVRPHHGSSNRSNAYSDETIVILKRKDLQEIAGCLQRIRQEQNMLRLLLRKHQLDQADVDDDLGTMEGPR